MTTYYTAPQGISEPAAMVLAEAGVVRLLGGEHPDIEWVRCKPPQTDARIIVSPATGRTHLANVPDEPELVQIKKSPNPSNEKSWTVDCIWEVPLKVFTLSDIDQDLLRSIRSTSEVAIGLLIQLMRFNASREENRPGTRIQGKRFYSTTRGRVAGHLVQSLIHMDAIAVNRLEWADIVFVTSKYKEPADRDHLTERLTHLKKGAFVVNTARSELVDKKAMAAALASGQVAGYAEDVTDGNTEWFDLMRREGRNVVYTEHLGGFAKESLEEVETALAQVVVDWLNGDK